MRELRSNCSFLFRGIVRLIHETDRTKRNLLIAVRRLNVPASIGPATRMPWANIGESPVCGENCTAHLLSVELVCVEVTL
jgi:hypothetical protein